MTLITIYAHLFSGKKNVVDIYYALCPPDHYTCAFIGAIQQWHCCALESWELLLEKLLSIRRRHAFVPYAPRTYGAGCKLIFTFPGRRKKPSANGRLYTYRNAKRLRVHTVWWGSKQKQDSIKNLLKTGSAVHSEHLNYA